MASFFQITGSASAPVHIGTSSASAFCPSAQLPQRMPGSFFQIACFGLTMRPQHVKLFATPAANAQGILVPRWLRFFEPPFMHRGLKRLYERDDRSGIRPGLLDVVEDTL